MQERRERTSETIQQFGFKENDRVRVSYKRQETKSGQIRTRKEQRKEKKREERRREQN
jgi:hypothetical protein